MRMILMYFSEDSTIGIIPTMDLEKKFIFLVKTGEKSGFFAIVKHSYSREGVLFNTSINFGGLHDKCVEVTIFYENGIATRAKINNILSEPECGVYTLLAEGKTVYMIKCMFQFVRSFPIFKNVKQFELDDMSHIYCDKDSINYEETTIPRRGSIRLGLPFFYIAYHQKTWYEEKFGAKLMDINRNTFKKYKNYREKMENFNKPLAMDFITFASRFGLNAEQYTVLEPLYNNALSYADFFKKIETDKCNILYNWIEGFVRYILDGAFDSTSWVINIDDIETIPFLGITEKIYDTYKSHITNLGKIVKRNLKTYRQPKIQQGGKRGITRKYRHKFRFAFSHEG